MVRNSPLKEPVSGHGLGLTRKYGVDGIQTEEPIKVSSENLRVRWLNWAFNIIRCGNRGKEYFVGRFTVFCLVSATLLSVSEERWGRS